LGELQNLQKKRFYPRNSTFFAYLPSQIEMPCRFGTGFAYLSSAGRMASAPRGRYFGVFVKRLTGAVAMVAARPGVQSVGMSISGKGAGHALIESSFASAVAAAVIAVFKLHPHFQKDRDGLCPRREPVLITMRTRQRDSRTAS
jgi:hypothetical protein